MRQQLMRDVCLGLLNEGDQIADQFGPEKIHRRGRHFREQNGPFLTHFDCFEIHGYLRSRVDSCSAARVVQGLFAKRRGRVFVAKQHNTRGFLFFDAAWEEPEFFVTEVRESFKSLR
jgi:hypothetical protein